MVAIRQQLVGSTRLTSGTGNPASSITVHQTGNTSKGANAAAHANLQSSGNVRQASWHWTVDDTEAVQSFAHSAKCWHAGTATGNGTSIGIEVCVNSDGDYAKALANAAELVAHVMAQTGVPIGKVVQHNHWSAKNCPAQIRAAQGGIGWPRFLEMVAGGSSAPGPVERNADGSLTIPWTGLRDGRLVGRWQEVMGTPVDFVISRPRSTLIGADQAYLNQVVAAEHIKNLTGKARLDVDRIEGTRTVKVRQFWLFNTLGPQVLGRPTKASDFDGINGLQTNRLHRAALNRATARSGRY